MSHRPLLLIFLLLLALLTAGCSYKPARIQSEPLVIFEEGRGYHDHGHGPGRGFCPPGLRKQGRC